MTTTPSMCIPVIEPLTPAVLRSLVATSNGPSVSVYLPTHRASPPDDLNRIVLKGLLADAAAALRASPDPANSDHMLTPLLGLMDSPVLRAPAHDGLAAFATRDGVRLVAIDGPVEPESVVDRRFHVLPLVRRVAAVEHCLVITITERIVRALVGHVSDRDGTRLVPLRLTGGLHPERGEVVREEIVEQQDSEPHRVLHGRGPYATGRVHGGFGARSDGIDIDTEHFLRAAAATVIEAPDRDADWPLVTVALPRLATLFDSFIAHVRGERVRVDRDPVRVDDAELADAVGDVLLEGRRRRREALIDSFREARAHGRGSGDLSDIARAAVAGQVATLLLDADRREDGGIDRATGLLLTVGSPAAAGTARRVGTPRGAGGADLYEDLVGIVVGHGGEIVPVNRIQMPTESGVAAIYRYPLT